MALNFHNVSRYNAILMPDHPVIRNMVEDIERLGYNVEVYADEIDYGEVVRFAVRCKPQLAVYSSNEVLTATSLIQRREFVDEHPDSFKIKLMHITKNMLMQAKKEIVKKQADMIHSMSKAEFGFKVLPPLEVGTAAKSNEEYREMYNTLNYTGLKSTKKPAKKPAKKQATNKDNFWR